MGSERKIPVEGHPLTGMSSDDRSETKSIEDTIPLGSNEVRNDYLIAVRKRTHAASIFELMIVVAIFIGVCIYYGMLYFSGVIVFSKPIFSFVFVSSGLTLFLEYALYILTNRTAAVLVVAFLFKTDLFMPSSEIPSGRRTYTSYTEEYFFTVVGRSVDTVYLSQRRPAALLFAGTVIAGAGLAFFIFTLPGGFLAPEPSGDIKQNIVNLAPRILMLLFIQILAGFFLRQYRSSMEEVRYYDRIARIRETELIRYLIVSSKGNYADVKEFAATLVSQKDGDSITLKEGERSIFIETQQGEVNEFRGVAEMIADIFRSAKIANKKSK